VGQRRSAQVSAAMAAAIVCTRSRGCAAFGSQLGSRRPARKVRARQPTDVIDGHCSAWSSPPTRCTPRTPTADTCTGAGRTTWLTVKGNRPTLARELAGLPWNDVKVAFTSRERRSRSGPDPGDQGRSPAQAVVLPARPPGHPSAATTSGARQQGSDRDRLRGHQPRLRPGHTSPARPDHPRALRRSRTGFTTSVA
jgi:hypothetical protein